MSKTQVVELGGGDARSPEEIAAEIVARIPGSPAFLFCELVNLETARVTIWACGESVGMLLLEYVREACSNTLKARGYGESGTA